MISPVSRFSGVASTHTRSAVLVLQSLGRGVRVGSLNDGRHCACRSATSKLESGVALRYAIRSGYE